MIILWELQMGRKLAYIIFLLILSLSAFSTDYFVDKYNGNDTFNGLYSSHTSGLNGPKRSIQNAIDSCAVNDNVFISAGLYQEYLTINKQMNLFGSGSGADTNLNTILQSPSSGTGTGLSIVFQGAAPIIFSNIKDLRIQQFQYGAVMASKVRFSNVVVANNSYYGFWNGPNIVLRDMDFFKCEMISNAKAGIYIGHSCDVIAWIVDSCNISDNGLAGIYIFCDNPATSNVIDFLLRNSTLKRNKQKGIYAEKLHNCLFQNLLFDSCGIDTNYNWNAGFDINLKFGSYTNVTVTSCEFTHCGLGGSNQAGCAMIVKARTDGSVYAANPASLSNSKILNNKFRYCKNGLMFGEPQENNIGPTATLIQENKLAYNENYNLITNIQSDIHAHNNSWLTTDGPGIGDTLISNTGDIVTYTWVKNISDQNSKMGFQSDSIVWFNKVSGNLQNAIDVVPPAWTLFIPDSFYHGNYHISNLMKIYPEQFVYISSLHFDKLAYVDLIHSDLYISDSITIHREGHFNTGNYAVELSDSGKIKEESGYVLQGRIRTSRYIAGNPDVEDFGGIGLTLTAKLSQPFPQNNVILSRITGSNKQYSKKQVWRSYDVFAHKSCNWDAELIFNYDESEIYHLTTDSNLILMKSYNSGINWQLNGGTVDTFYKTLRLDHVSNVNGFWGMIDSSGTIVPAGMTLDKKITDCSCPGSADGQIQITAEGGFKPYSYLWSDGNQTDTVDSLRAGSYWIQVSDTNGCSIIDTISIEQPNTIISNAFVKEVGCFAGSDGKITLNPQGGTPPFHVSWLIGDTSSILKNLDANTYIVTITDSNNCLSTDSIIVGEPDIIKIFADIKDISCFGKSNGRIFTIVVGGKAPYQFFWTHGSSTDSLYNLKKGFYYLSIFDSNACIMTDTFEVKQPDKLKLHLEGHDVRCYETYSGSITSTVLGGTPPYLYEWSDSNSTADRFFLMKGFYALTIYDSNNCIVSDSVEINQPDELLLSLILVNDTNKRCVGTAEAFVSGGIIPYHYQYDDPNFQDSSKAIGLCAGKYYLLITDSNGCEVDSLLEIINITNPGFEDLKAKIKIYPNPVHDVLFIEAKELITTIEIYNLNTQLIETIPVYAKKASIKLPGLTHGSYLLKASSLNGVYMKLIIKE